MGHCDSLTVRLAALRCLRLAIPSVRPLFVPIGPDAWPWIILELVYRLLRPACHDGDGQGLPGSRETLVIIRHVLRPRWDQARSWTKCQLAGAAPACDNDEGSRQWRFRGSIAQRLISLSTLRGDGHPSPRKTRFRLLARLCRTGLVTRRVSMKGFTF